MELDGTDLRFWKYQYNGIPGSISIKPKMELINSVFPELYSLISFAIVITRKNAVNSINIEGTTG